MIDHIPTDDLSALIDDALQPARRSQVEAHLVGCASCRDELATLRWAVDFARALPLAPLPDDFELRLPEATAARAARELALDSRPIRPWAGLLALAAVLTLGLLLSYLARLSQTPLQSGDAAADAEASEAVRSQMAEAPAGSIGPAAAAPGRGLDIDRAAGIAEERMASEDAPETLLQPLATALTGDRTLTGELGQRSSDRSTGPEAAATASVVAADSGGYRPPDAQIPGAAAARDDSAPVAATASALTAVRATAVAALEVLNAAGSGEPPPEAGGGSPELAATREALAAMQPEATLSAVATTIAALPISASPPARADAAADPGSAPELALAALATATARARSDGAPIPSAGADVDAANDAAPDDLTVPPAAAEQPKVEAGPTPPPPTARIVSREQVAATATADAARQLAVAQALDEAAAVDGDRAAAEALAPESASPPASADATSRLLVPLTAITIGLLALGLLLLRQVGRQRRRRRHLDL